VKVSELNERYKRALKKRTPFEAGYQDCYDYALPGRTNFFNESVGQDNPEIFDETAVIAVPEFASRIQAGLIPNFSKWVSLEAGADVPAEERDEVNTALEDITEQVFAVILNSNFGQEAHECLIDIALGTACMEITEGDALHPVNFSAVPLSELALDVGFDDRLDDYFRTRTMRVSALKKKWPDVTLPDNMIKSAAGGATDKDPLVKVVISSIRTHNVEHEYEYTVFLPAYEFIIAKQKFTGNGSSNFVGFRWSKAAGEAWGRGPLFNTLPAVRTANLVVQMVLENAEMSIAGIYTAEDDGIVNVNNIRLIPGTIIPVAPGSQGLQPLQGAGNFDVSQLVLNEMRANIRKALFNETLGSPDTTPMSATEVQQRMSDLSRQIGSSFGRLQVEFVNRVVQRVVYILRKQGRIELPVINGREIKIVSTSPLAQAQAVEDINSVQNWLQLMAQHFGPQVVQIEVDTEQTTEYLADKFGVPSRLKRTDESKQQLMQTMQQMQQGATDAQGPPDGPPS
jgi:hypothetical protein